jgi:two-component system cell cycle response regulator
MSIEGKKILWVEDDQFMTSLLARRIADEKGILLHAPEGEKALEILKTETPDVIMLDILLPGMDGYEILRQVKANPKTRQIPVILLSNLGQKADTDRGAMLGANRFLVKAIITLDQIVKEISSVLEETKKSF